VSDSGGGGNGGNGATGTSGGDSGGGDGVSDSSGGGNGATGTSGGDSGGGDGVSDSSGGGNGATGTSGGDSGGGNGVSDSSANDSSASGGGEEPFVTDPSATTKSAMATEELSSTVHESTVHSEGTSTTPAPASTPVVQLTTTVSSDQVVKKSKKIALKYRNVMTDFEALQAKVIGSGTVEKFYNSGRAQRTGPMPQPKYKVTPLLMLPTMLQSTTSNHEVVSCKKMPVSKKYAGLSAYAKRVTECANNFRKQVILFNPEYTLLESSKKLKSNLKFHNKEYYGKCKIDFSNPCMKCLVDLLDLEDPEHFGHGVDVLGDGTCWVTSVEQSLASMAVECDMNKIKADLIALLVAEMNVATYDSEPSLSALSRFQHKRYADPDSMPGQALEGSDVQLHEILVSTPRDSEQYLDAVAHYTSYVKGLMDEEKAWLDELSFIYLPRVIGRDIHFYSTVVVTESWEILYANSARTPSALPPLHWIANGKHYVPLIKNRDLIENWSPLDSSDDEKQESVDDDAIRMEGSDLN
jgi:very-short-patch-repair endonuclease